MKKIAIAASSVALAAMPVVGVFALNTDDTQVVDTIQVTVQASCTFRAEGGNGMKILSCTSGKIPLPLSLTESWKMCFSA